MYRQVTRDRWLSTIARRMRQVRVNDCVYYFADGACASENLDDIGTFAFAWYCKPWGNAKTQCRYFIATRVED